MFTLAIANLPGTLLALLTGVSGWYYLFYSKAAQNLAGVEEDATNRRRVRLRRVGGGVMLALAIALYLGFAAAESDRVQPRLFLAVWSAVMILLATLVLLALIDVWLTVRLRRRRLLRNRGSSLDRIPPVHTPPDP